MLGMKLIAQHFPVIPVNIDITDITLLSIEEYEAAETNIPSVDGWWWLRSPNCLGLYAACVRPGGGVNDNGHIITGYIGVRPAIRINSKSVNLQIGDKVRLEGFTWTYVSEGILLCDSIIIKMPFRKDWKAEDANHYEASDVKAYLDKRLVICQRAKVCKVPRDRDNITI